MTGCSGSTGSAVELVERAGCQLGPPIRGTELGFEAKHSQPFLPYPISSETSVLSPVDLQKENADVSDEEDENG